ncbi:MAG: quinone-dependent dihydroorotate dehydrogenase [Acidobacteria bacterium]|nr:quinone-dependent dihydroorotate dehydrogenase [Acidobacteriota bacterium]
MSRFFQSILRPALFRLSPETAHELAMKALRAGIVPGSVGSAERNTLGKLAVEKFGLRFPNPLGLAAGFDKNAVAVNQLASLGFGFVEVGTITLHPQPGNPKPRMFRLPEDNALINRLGFNNEGAKAVTKRLAAMERECIVGVNIGKNKDVPNEEAVENYLAAFDLAHPVADYISVNVSSPNTPNLRELQEAESLAKLLGELMKRNIELGKKPLLVKIAPDLENTAVLEAVDICLENSVDGIIATNTTISREGLKTANVDAIGAGGLSGKPLQKRSNEVISVIYKHSGGRLPIIGVGGIFTAQDAYDKIVAGASLLQAYTGFIYGGPYFARDVVEGLVEILDKKGISSLDEAVGSSHR